jgi:regulation of enolase protein 1 (concanavalin A-like superfamily)
MKDGMDFLIHWRTPNESWTQLRIAHLHTEIGFVQCGLYACCQIDVGFRAEFHFVEIRYK